MADPGKTCTGKTFTGKTWVFVSEENARLNELMTLIGCRNEIAVLDVDQFGRRAGELIARAASTSAYSGGIDADLVGGAKARPRKRRHNLRS